MQNRNLKSSLILASIICLIIFSSFSKTKLEKFADGIVKSIDKRTMSSADGNVYYLVFVSKPTKLQGGQNAGHAYVVWGVEDNIKKMSYGDAWGLYPLSTMKTLTLATVPGELRNDGIASNNYNRLIVKVDKKVYDAAHNKMKEWASKGTYQLLERDCLSFTIDMAGIAALNTPPRMGYDNVPWNYLIAMINGN